MSGQKAAKSAGGQSPAGRKIQQPKGFKKELSKKSRAYRIFCTEHKDDKEYLKKGKKGQAKAFGKAWQKMSEEEQEV